MAEESSPRSRIRDAALREFATHGFKGATVRGIAQEAGVSAGLVQHHFPSKEALQEECDAYVLDFLRSGKDQLLRVDADPTTVAALQRTVVPITRYLAMALVSETPAASQWFDSYVEFHRQTLTSGEMGPAIPTSEDSQAIAAVWTAMYLGQVVMFDHLLRALGTHEDDPEVALRIGRAKLYLTSERILDPATATQIRAMLGDFERNLQSTGEIPNDNS